MWQKNYHGQLNLEWQQQWGIWKLPYFFSVQITVLSVTVRSAGVLWGRLFTICGEKILCRVGRVWYTLMCCIWPYRGSVLSLLVTMSEFNQWPKIKFLHRLQKSATDTLIRISDLYGIKALKNLLCKTHKIDFKMVMNHDKTINNSPTCQETLKMWPNFT